MNKLTKIVATIGPASDSPETIEKLIRAGVDIFRFNFKHNTVEWHNERIIRVNRAAKKLGRSIGTLIDLQGPEIRINMLTEELKIKNGELILFGQEAFNTKEKAFSISHPQVIEHLHEGQKLLADDGSFTFYVKKKSGKIYLCAHSVGILKNHKSLNIPGADFPFPVLVDRDFEGLKLAQRNEVDFVALSFVRMAEDIIVVRREMKKYHVDAKMIAKIETKKALDNLEKIIEVSDGVMVARGDLGVELPIEEVPYYQKIIIKETIRRGLPVITATQMLQSMVQNPFPTRAEVSDIANATFDLTDSVMLSAETALGKHPIVTVELMVKTVAFNENKNKVDSRDRFHFETNDTESVFGDAAYGLYVRLRELKYEIAGFLVFTQTGRTVRLISRYRPLVPIYALTPNDKVSNSLSISFGVVPFSHIVSSNEEVTKKQITAVIKMLKDKKLVKKKQLLIVIHGNVWAVKGGTSTITVAQVE